jgi:hypothetical protein
MGIRFQAFEACGAPAADGFHRLPSIDLRTKRDVMQSRKMTVSADAGTLNSHLWGRRCEGKIAPLLKPKENVGQTQLLSMENL